MPENRGRTGSNEANPLCFSGWKLNVCSSLYTSRHRLCYRDARPLSIQPRPRSLEAAKKVLRYLQGTKDYKLVYKRSDNLEVIGYSDSDFAKCKDDKKSTSGYIFMLSGGPISWRSHKQKLTTTSTMMAEYVVVYNATCHGMLLRNLIKGLMIVNSIERPLKIYCDNSAAVCFSNNNSSSGAGLYLDTKYLFVRERVEENDICIEYIGTN